MNRLELKKMDSRLRGNDDMVSGNDGRISSNDGESDASSSSRMRGSSVTSIWDEITILENQIDQMVYELYGLSDDEIKVIEGCR
jgi:hypothetical protein